MRTLRTIGMSAAAVVVLLAHPAASGLVGIYGMVERVAFEPNDANPERVQLWGAFAYASGGVERGSTWSPVKRGYLYFAMPSTTVESKAMIRREWEDLRSVAGKHEAVGFGRWAYIGAFDQLSDGSGRPRIYMQSGGSLMDVRVRAADEPATYPAWYDTNAGVVRLPADGSHAELVAQLRDALKKR